MKVGLVRIVGVITNFKYLTHLISIEQLKIIVIFYEQS